MKITLPNPESLKIGHVCISLKIGHVCIKIAHVYINLKVGHVFIILPADVKTNLSSAQAELH